MSDVTVWRAPPVFCSLSCPQRAKSPCWETKWLGWSSFSWLIKIVLWPPCRRSPAITVSNAPLSSVPGFQWSPCESAPTTTTSRRRCWYIKQLCLWAGVSPLWPQVGLFFIGLPQTISWRLMSAWWMLGKTMVGLSGTGRQHGGMTFSDLVYKYLRIQKSPPHLPKFSFRTAAPIFLHFWAWPVTAVTFWP